MGINAWILGGIAVNDKIVEPAEGCWKRPDLVHVPDALKYSEICMDCPSVKIYENNIGVAVVFIWYGEFGSEDEMYADYYSAEPNTAYLACYHKVLEILNKRYGGNDIKDLDWVMPILEGTFDIQENVCTIPRIGEDCKEYVTLIDNSVIYTSVRHISGFVHEICNKKKLSKYQRWQLAYYQMAVQSVEAPTVFLTNKEEIEMSELLYERWQIGDNIRAVIDNMNQVVALFSFLSNCEEQDENDLFSSFLTFFGIIVGLEAIYNLLVALFADMNQWLKMVLIVLISASVLAFGLSFIRKLLKKILENREFKKKTRR